MKLLFALNITTMKLKIQLGKIKKKINLSYLQND